MDQKDIAHNRSKLRGRPAPEDITVPGADQESVWDYPRPPLVQAIRKKATVTLNDHLVVSSRRLLKVMETASPPTYYFSPDDVDRTCLIRSTRTTFCEWKGGATYWHVEVKGERAENAAWSYEDPLTEVADYTPLRSHIAFYPHALLCTLVGERIDGQQGQFYGGWITSDITGPFKGPPGTEGW